jgi:predicted Zn-dependent protease
VALPRLAIALAMAGHLAEANTLAASLPGDCYLCVRARARIAAANKDWPQVDHWFSEAVRQAPALPLAESEWGEALLEKADADGAIQKLTLAAQKGPRFAEPAELWGEALLRKGAVRDAIAKFDAANDLAPHWGHLHLRRGEALAKFGKSDAAAKEFALAASLDLPAADAAELRRARSAR